MTVTYNPFVSKSGFKSEGFEVNSLGNIAANNVVVNSVDASVIKLNGVPIFGGVGDSSAAPFQLESDFIVSQSSTVFLSVIDGRVIINNRQDSVGSIDNVEIGSITPAPGTFTSITTGPLGIPSINSSTNLLLSAVNAVVFRINSIDKGRVDASGINIPIVDTTINDTVIGNTTPNTGAFTSVSIINQPLTESNATRKDYVDNRISAFAIAFGA